MTPFVLFTMYAPLSSWGEITVGENRGSWERPSRSAILGLVAAALGITREDQDGHDALDGDYGMAVRSAVSGISMMDYQTVQTVAESGIRKRFGKGRPETRRELLAIGNHETLVTRRELYQDALTTCVLWSVTETPRWSLKAIRDALERPKFVLYAGRKANAFALPLGPSLDDAASLAHAFISRPFAMATLELQMLKASGSDWGTEVAHDPLPKGASSGLTPVRTETRRDNHAHRSRWQFSDRVVNIGLMPKGISP